MQNHEQQFEIDLAEKLRSLGYRFTPQRKIVMEAVQQIRGHFTPQAVYNRINSVKESAVDKSAKADQATVYRTLELFQKLGILYSSQVHGQTVFELAGEVPHHHLVCRSCSAGLALDDHLFDDLVNHLDEDHQFKAELAHLTISGLCGACQ